MEKQTELKLAYLQGTKDAIKNALIEKGQDVSNSDTFRSYADKILAITGGSGDGTNINLDGLTELFPVTEITVPSDGDGTVPMMEPIGLKTGSIYLVVWNDVCHICEAKNVEYNGIPAIALGNGIAWGGENTEEPFAIGEIPEEYVSMTGGVHGLIIPLDGSTKFKAGGYFICENSGSNENVLEDLPITLNFSNGNQTVTAPEGSLVKSAIIQKPDTLVPENVVQGINIAGIIGAATTVEGSGTVVVGGKKLMFTIDTMSGYVTEDTTRVIGKFVCTPDQPDPFFIMVFRQARNQEVGDSSIREFQYAYAFDTNNYEVLEGYGNNDSFNIRRVAYSDNWIGLTWTSTTNTGMKDPIDTSNPECTSDEKRMMHTGDILYYRDSNGYGCIDVGLPERTAQDATWKWNTWCTNRILVLSWANE